MNFYIIVEGDQTEMSVYPAWLSILAPAYVRIKNAWDVEVVFQPVCPKSVDFRDAVQS